MKKLFFGIALMSLSSLAFAQTEKMEAKVAEAKAVELKVVDAKATKAKMADAKPTEAKMAEARATKQKVEARKAMEAVPAENAKQAQANATLEKAEIATVSNESLKLSSMDHDFGKIPQGKPVTTEFVVTNISKQPFKLESVVAGCGCTTPVWDRDAEIAPGASQKITVGFNAGAVGAFNKPVTITYNNGQTKQIFIKGEVYNTPAESAPANQTKSDL